MRSRLPRNATPDMIARITSACAEQTGNILYHGGVRGGSPPRVRSRPVREEGLLQEGRITSACAEQTRTLRNASPFNRDHLRVCGADMCMLLLMLAISGSPPRVRSRRYRCRSFAQWLGITSACAEQTRRTADHHRADGDHLRVCGADAVAALMKAFLAGSPPRVRSRQYSRRSPWD